MSYQPFATGRKRVAAASNTPSTLFSTAEVNKAVTGIHVTGGAAARVVTIRTITGSVVLCTIKVGAAQTYFEPFAFFTAALGIEALTDSATADVEVVMPYFD